MNRTDIKRLFDFDQWATLRTIEAVASLTEEQRQKDLGTSFGSIHATLVHILSADRVWLRRWQSGTPVPLKPEDVPGLDALKKQWDACFLDMSNVLRSLTDDALAAPFPYTDFRGNPVSLPLEQQMLHKVNHATYHRGQVTTLVRQLGGKPLGTDMMIFFRQKEQHG